MIKETKAYLDSEGGMWRTEQDAINADAHAAFISMLRNGAGARPSLFPYLSKGDMKVLYRELKGIYG